MKKTILGVDIGHDQLKLALVKGSHVLKTASVPMPENLLRDGRITSRESMAELIRTTMKANGMRANRAAFVLPNETIFVKNVEMPLMTVDQLKYNLPFEFNDYITGELRDYVFDYAVLSDEPTTASEYGEPEGDGTPSMELMAVGVLRAVVEDAQETLRKVGLRLVLAAPALCAYISLLRARQGTRSGEAGEYAVLDLGYEAIRMYIFRGDRHIATRVLEIGLSVLDGVLADVLGVDIHLAHTYLTTNYENMGTVGSIRSSREVFASRIPDYDAIYVHAGGSPGAYNIISERALASLDGANMYLPSTYFRDQWRLNNIGYEHSLMTNGAGIVSGIQFKGYRTELKSDFTPPFTFYNEQNNHLTGGPAAAHVRIYATPIQTVDYVYDAASGQYLRYHYNGLAHKDGTSGKQIAVKNVIVLFMDIGLIPGDDKSRVDVSDVGTGSGYYITNGQRAEIVWSRASSYDTMHYSYTDGTPLVLNAGKTFINIVETAAANTISFNYQW